MMGASRSGLKARSWGASSAALLGLCLGLGAATGSDLVIDKFVYDPKKGTGQIAASFSKGVMRFVGGKISKNEGGVTVNTPAGALAIRGGIAHADLQRPKNLPVF